MLNNGKKTAISIASTACLCLLLILVAVQHHRVQVNVQTGEEEDAGTRSLLQSEEEPQLGGAQAKKGFSAYFTKLTRGRREVEKPARASASAAEPPPAEDISADDIFIAVKTTKKFHRSRLNLLLDTWISRNMQQTYIFTDGEDEELKRKLHLSQYPHTQDMYIGKPSLDRPIEATERLGDNKMKPVNFWFATGGAGFCVSRGLALKMSPWASGGHFMNTAEKIRLPDDCTIGYIIESVLGVPLTRSNLFHSHLENLQQVQRSEIHKQITLSYGMFENKSNIINLKGAFPVEEDPSRFKSVHCLLYPDTPWCPPQVAF
ncbi:hypothetical protein INR49_011113 [Caranx melampygus]|nr:hypothetical protein INR49_011113 [Caranx melampygus]